MDLSSLWAVVEAYEICLVGRGLMVSLRERFGRLIRNWAMNRRVETKCTLKALRVVDIT